MDSKNVIQTMTGLIWIIVGILIIVWLLFPSDVLLLGLWWMFAIGCILTGQLMLIEPLFSKKK